MLLISAFTLLRIISSHISIKYASQEAFCPNGNKTSHNTCISFLFKCDNGLKPECELPTIGMDIVKTSLTPNHSTKKSQH
ncbi:hypothetical protein M758_1G270600 [Ceratodon purpureus]|nr:hypothetical protein M758_1G270600 [Ceratodon purpureus]